jgi:hypothetical protein
MAFLDIGVKQTGGLDVGTIQSSAGTTWQLTATTRATFSSSTTATVSHQIPLQATAKAVFGTTAVLTSGLSIPATALGVPIFEVQPCLSGIVYWQPVLEGHVG